jgi:hypothetical protein
MLLLDGRTLAKDNDFCLPKAPKPIDINNINDKKAKLDENGKPIRFDRKTFAISCFTYVSSKFITLAIQ